MAAKRKATVSESRPDGVMLVAIWHFIVAGLCLLGLCGMSFPFLGLWLGRAGGVAPGVFIGTLALMFGVVWLVAFGVAFAVTGWGLWKLRPWARMAAVVLAVLQLVLFPIGTIIGALTLWYLLSDEDAKMAFEAA